MRRSLLTLICCLLPLVLPADTIDLSVTTGDIHVLGPDANTFMGFSVATGDLNGDGLMDMVMGAPYASPGGRSSAGKVFVTFGDTTVTDTIDLSAAVDVVVEGKIASGLLGYRVTTGDLNGDGLDDLILAAPFATSNAGVVYVIHGDSTLSGTIDLNVTNAAVTLTGGPGHRAGIGLASGDADGDGVDDLVIGAIFAAGPSRSRAGRVHIFYGSTLTSSTYNLNNNVADLVIWGVGVDDNLGNDVALMDIDGDGLDEVVMSAYHADPDGESAAGEVYILPGDSDYNGTYGPTYDLASPQASLIRIKGVAAGDQAGQAIALGDMNYDGVPDLAIGANAAEASQNRLSSGIVYVIDGQNLSGTLDLADTADVLFRVYGAASNNGLGFDLEMLNANADGMADLLIAAPFSATQGAQTGDVHLITGDTQFPAVLDLSVTDADWKILGAASGNNTGRDIAGGDINGDGIDDLILGVAGATGAAAGSGQVVVLLGIQPNVDMSTPDTTSRYSSTVDIPLTVDATTGLKMVEIDLDLLFDRDVVTYTTFDTVGTLVAGWDSILVSLLPGGVSEPDTIRMHGHTMGASAKTTGTLFNTTFDVTDLRQPDVGDVEISYLLFNGGLAEWNDLTAGSVQVVGADAALVATVVSAPGDTVRVRVTDHDANLDSTLVDTAIVAVTNSRTGETETLRLAEQSINDSVFFATMFTLGADSAGVDDDGTMQVADDDTVAVIFVDSLDALGAATNRGADHLVLDPLGDADGNDALQAFDASRILAHAAGLITLSGRDSMAANVDILAPTGPINSFDAVLVIQARLGMLSRFPIQQDDSANHPQPETDVSVPKKLPELLWVSWRSEGADLVLEAEDRQRILSGDLWIEGIQEGVALLPAADLIGAELVHQTRDNRLHVAFAIPVPAAGTELLRIRPRPGVTLPAPSQITVDGMLNGGEVGILTRSVSSTSSQLPRILYLHPNHPNPFNAETMIRFDLPAPGWVELSIYNSLGQRLNTLLAESRPAGAYQMVWSGTTETGRPVASGSYVYVLESDGVRIARSALLLK